MSQPAKQNSPGYRAAPQRARLFRRIAKARTRGQLCNVAGLRPEPSCATRECAVAAAQLAAAGICERVQAPQLESRADARDRCERPVRIAASYAGNSVLGSSIGI